MAKCTDINPSDYFICLIDIMGQKEFFKSITSLKVEKQVQEDIIRVSSGLKEIIRYIRNRYDKHFTKEECNNNINNKIFTKEKTKFFLFETIIID